jgi:ribonuclease HI
VYLAWPPDGFTKVNSDGGIQGDLNLAASGVVARDATDFYGAMCKIYTGISDPITIEALALRDAFKYATERGFTQVIFEVDCAELVKSWQKGQVDRSVIRPILEEIRDISLSFISCNVVSVRREANQVAHCCAKFALVQEGSFTWNVEAPEFLAHSLSADCNPAM